MKRNFAETTNGRLLKAECLLNKLKEVLKQVLRENGQKGEPKCFNCGKGGYFQRNCKAKRNISTPVPPTRQRVVATPKASGGHYVETCSSKGMRGKLENSEDHSRSKIPKIESNMRPKQPPDTYKAAQKTEVIKAEKKKSIVTVRRMQIEANEDWSAAQRSGPILAKIIAGKEEDKRPTRNEISGEDPLTKAYWALWDSLRLINGCLYRHWESTDGKTSSNLLVVICSKMKEVLNELHNGASAGNLGATKTLERIKQCFFIGSDAIKQ